MANPILIERFEAKYIPEPMSGCWLWIGALSANGRSSFANTTGHRFAYLQYRGEVPDGLELDHLCCNPACVNPWHLEPVTRSINLKRYWDYRGLADPRRQQTICLEGHPLSGDNLRIDPKTHRKICRACDRRRARTYWRAKHAKGNSHPVL